MLQAGVSRTDSADELTSFFRLLANQLSQSPDDVIARMKEDEVRIVICISCALSWVLHASIFTQHHAMSLDLSGL